MQTKSLVVYFGLFSLCLHFLAATYSTGYQNSDEHFQILEFLNYRLGRTSAADLAIEFHQHLRPWLQPMFYEVPTRLLRHLGVESPFDWAWMIRLISAFVGWLSVMALTLKIPLWIKDPRWQRYAVVLFATTWYFPAFHARHSSENMSGALFLLGTCVLLGDTAAVGLGVAGGFLLGLGFECRFQTAIMIVSLFLWMGIVAKTRIKYVLAAGLGCLLAVALGTVLDRVGYGQWVFTPWNYFKYNLLDGNVFPPGEYHPWWDYFRRIWTETWPVLGFISLFGLIVGCVRNPRNVFTWCAVPFFLVHLLLPHKETRFLLPMAGFAPLMLILALVPEGLLAAKGYRTPWAKRLAMSLMGFNFLALIVLCFIPASLTMEFYEAVYDRRISEIYYSERNPYLALGLPLSFYRRDGMTLPKLEKTYQVSPQSTFWLGYPRAMIEHEMEVQYHIHCQLESSTLPPWLLALDKPGLLWRATNWSLFLCAREYNDEVL